MEIQNHQAIGPLTGLRGMAALWVLFYHAWVLAIPAEITLKIPFGTELSLHPLISVGWAGVQIFFTLSAFLLTLPYASHNISQQRPPSTLKFLARRITRVFPAYYAQLIVLTVLSYIFAGYAFPLSEHIASLLSMNFLPPPIGDSSLLKFNGSWWTLPIELSFYLLVPVIGRFAQLRLLHLVLGVSLGITWAYRLWIIYQPELVNGAETLWFSQLPGSADSFGAGMILAVLYTEFQNSGAVWKNRFRQCVAPLMTLSVALLLGITYWIDKDFLLYRELSWITFWWTPLFTLATSTIIFCLAVMERNPGLMRGLLSKLLMFLGTISYGVYLWHFPIANWLIGTPWFDPHTSYVFYKLAAMTLLLSIGAGLISWKLVEQPLIQRVALMTSSRRS